MKVMPNDTEVRPQKRRPRFARCETPTTVRLTERDIAMLVALDTHGTLTSLQLAALMVPDAADCAKCSGSGKVADDTGTLKICSTCNGLRKQGYKKCVARLTELFHAGLIARPRSQVDFFRMGSSRFVYRLEKLGAEELEKLDGRDRPRDWHRQNELRREFIEHAVAISDFRVMLANALRSYAHIELHDEPALLAAINQDRAERKPPLPPIARIKFNPSKQIAGNKTPVDLAAVPDVTFSLTHGGKRYMYLVEVDRGTMPDVRTGRSLWRQTSILGKCHGYGEALTQNLHWSEFGWKKFAVLILTNSPQRAENIRAVIRNDKSLTNQQWIYVSDVVTLAATTATSNILEHAWVNAFGTPLVLARPARSSTEVAR